MAAVGDDEGHGKIGIHHEVGVLGSLLFMGNERTLQSGFLLAPALRCLLLDGRGP